MTTDEDRIYAILRDVKQLAREYYALTGKPLGITGECAEYEAARLLGLKLMPARETGYDAQELVENAPPRRLQIKGRCLADHPKPGQRLGALRADREWDAALLVLLDRNFDAVEIWEAERAPLLVALAEPGSIARNVRGALSVNKFKAIGHLRWPKDSGGKQ